MTTFSTEIIMENTVLEITVDKYLYTQVLTMEGKIEDKITPQTVVSVMTYDLPRYSGLMGMTVLLDNDKVINITASSEIVVEAQEHYDRYKEEERIKKDVMIVVHHDILPLITGDTSVIDYTIGSDLPHDIHYTMLDSVITAIKASYEVEILVEFQQDREIGALKIFRNHLNYINLEEETV